LKSLSLLLVLAVVAPAARADDPPATTPDAPPTVAPEAGGFAVEAQQRLQAAQDAVVSNFVGVTMAKIENLAPIPDAPADAPYSPELLALDKKYRESAALYEQLRVSGGAKFEDSVKKLGQKLTMSEPAVKSLTARYASVFQTLVEKKAYMKDGQIMAADGTPIPPAELAKISARSAAAMSDSSQIFNEQSAQLVAIHDLAKSGRGAEAAEQLNKLLDGMSGDKATLTAGVATSEMGTTLAMVQWTRSALPKAQQADVDKHLSTMDRQLRDILRHEVSVPGLASGARTAPGDHNGQSAQTKAELSLYASLSSMPGVSSWAKKQYDRVLVADTLSADARVKSFAFSEKDPWGTARSGVQIQYKDNSSRYESMGSSDKAYKVVSADGSKVIESDARRKFYDQKVGGVVVAHWETDPKTGETVAQFHGRNFTAPKGETPVLAMVGAKDHPVEKLLFVKDADAKGNAKSYEWLGASDSERGVRVDGLGTAEVYLKGGKPRAELQLDKGVAARIGKGEKVDLSALALDEVDKRDLQGFSSVLNGLPQMGELFSQKFKAGGSPQKMGQADSGYVQSISVVDGRMEILMPDAGGKGMTKVVAMPVYENGQKTMRAFVSSGNSTFIYKYSADGKTVDMYRPGEGSSYELTRRMTLGEDGKWTKGATVPADVQEYTPGGDWKTKGQAALTALGQTTETIFSPLQSALYGVEGSAALTGGMIGSAISPQSMKAAEIKVEGVYTLRQAKLSPLANGTETDEQVLEAYRTAKAAIDSKALEGQFDAGLCEKSRSIRRAQQGELFLLHKNEPCTEKDMAYAAAGSYGLGTLAKRYFEQGRSNMEGGSAIKGGLQYGVGLFVAGGETFVEGAGFGAASTGLKMLTAARLTGQSVEQVGSAMARLASGAADVTSAEKKASAIVRGANTAEMAAMTAPGLIQGGIDTVGFGRALVSGDRDAAWEHAQGLTTLASTFGIGAGLKVGQKVAERFARAPSEVAGRELVPQTTVIDAEPTVIREALPLHRPALPAPDNVIEGQFRVVSEEVVPHAVEAATKGLIAQGGANSGGTPPSVPPTAKQLPSPQPETPQTGGGQTNAGQTTNGQPTTGQNPSAQTPTSAPEPASGSNTLPGGGDGKQDKSQTGLSGALASLSARLKGLWGGDAKASAVRRVDEPPIGAVDAVAEAPGIREPALGNTDGIGQSRRGVEPRMATPRPEPLPVLAQDQPLLTHVEASGGNAGFARIDTYHEPGRTNQDAIALSTAKDKKYFVVADGMGGHGHGEVASSIAREVVQRHLDERITPHTTPEQAKGILRDAMQEAHARISAVNEGVQDANHSATTLSAGVFVKDASGRDVLVSANVGDSGVFVHKANGELHKVTRDDSLVELVEKQGIYDRLAAGGIDVARVKRESRITAADIKQAGPALDEIGANVPFFGKLLEEAKVTGGDIDLTAYEMHPKRNIVTNGIGTGDMPLGDHNISVTPVAKGDLVFAASDGVSDNLGHRRMESVLAAHDGASAHEVMQGLAREAAAISVKGKKVDAYAKKDDISAVGIRVGDEAPATAAQAPAARVGGILAQAQSWMRSLRSTSSPEPVAEAPTPQPAAPGLFGRARNWVQERRDAKAAEAQAKADQAAFIERDRATRAAMNAQMDVFSTKGGQSTIYEMKDSPGTLFKVYDKIQRPTREQLQAQKTVQDQLIKEGYRVVPVEVAEVAGVTGLKMPRIRGDNLIDLLQRLKAEDRDNPPGTPANPDIARLEREATAILTRVDEITQRRHGKGLSDRPYNSWTEAKDDFANFKVETDANGRTHVVNIDPFDMGGFTLLKDGGTPNPRPERSQADISRDAAVEHDRAAFRARNKGTIDSNLRLSSNARVNAIRRQMPDLMDAQVEAVMRAHEDYPCAGRGCTRAQLDMKNRILADAGMAPAQIAKAKDLGLAGAVTLEPGSVIADPEHAPLGSEVSRLSAGERKRFYTRVAAAEKKAENLEPTSRAASRLREPFAHPESLEPLVGSIVQVQVLEFNGRGEARIPQGVIGRLESAGPGQFRVSAAHHDVGSPTATYSRDWVFSARNGVVSSIDVVTPPADAHGAGPLGVRRVYDAARR
jgi:serine/threonine protein phosphatase PrpC